MSQGMHSRISETNRVRSNGPRQSRGASSTALSGPNPKSMIDRFAIVPILACVFALIAAPLFAFLNPASYEAVLSGADPRPENRIFWPAMAAISVIFAVQNRSRLTLPPNIICLVAYLAFAGASVLWAFSPEHSFIRYLQQTMIVTSIVLPAMLASRTVDMMRALYLCFASSVILSLFWVLGGSATIVNYGSQLINIGYQGYFNG